MFIINKLSFNKREIINIGEAYTVWTQVLARYDTLEMTQYWESQIHDDDLKALVAAGIHHTIKPQIKRLEDFAELHQIQLPPRPPKNTNVSYVTNTAKDESIFRIIMDGTQTQLMLHIKAINIATNNQLRRMYREFLEEDLDNYDYMLKYAKHKGWLKSPPAFAMTGSQNTVHPR